MISSKPQPTDFYEPWEFTINSWPEFQEQVNQLTLHYPSARMLWRGARDATWGVESSLYRGLTAVLGERPTEAQMVAAEEATLDRARNDWRFDGMPALETLAHLQHFGGPTRLLDVTENPLIALWFATESALRDAAQPTLTPADIDGRIFAFVTPKADVRLNDRWNGRHPVWHDAKTDADRRKYNWGTGLGRRYWRPPAFNSRISSQSAGFLIDGVTIDSPEHGLGRKSPGTEATWSVREMREFASIPLKMTAIRAGELPASAAPVFTIRVSATGKAEMRDQLESRYGYRASSVYSDIAGLANYLASRPETLLS